MKTFLKTVWMLIALTSVYLVMAQEVKKTLFYCCTPSGRCAGKGYETMGSCQQACTGGDEHARCQARQTEFVQPGNWSYGAPPWQYPAGIPGIAPESVTGNVQAISDQGEPVVTA